MATGDIETREPGTVDESLRSGRPMPSTPATQTGTSAGTSNMPSSMSAQSQGEGIGAAVGEAQTTSASPGDRGDLIDLLNDLVECCKDGEYGFHACAEHAKREDLKSVFTLREQDCQRGAQELQAQIRQLGGEVKDSGSVLGALHRGWVSVKSTLSTQDDKATLEDAERGEDNAMARYRKALKQPLPAPVRALVERQMEGVQRNHDQIKMLRDQFVASP